MGNSDRYLLRECDRCGFRFYKNELTKRNGLWLDKECVDAEKLSKKSLGGEGEIGASDIRANWNTYTTPSASEPAVFIVTNSGGISANLNIPWMIVMASATIARYTLVN